MVELIGNKRVFERLRIWLDNWNNEEYKAFLMIGEPGIGKTESATSISRELGYHVLEFNASADRGEQFMDELCRILSVRPIFPTVVLLDEVDGFRGWKRLVKCLKTSTKPVIMTANEDRSIPMRSLRAVAEIHYLYPPSSREVIRFVKDKGNNLNQLTNLRDVRQALLAVKYGSMGYERTEKPWTKVSKYLKTGDVKYLNSRNLLLWVVENIDLYSPVNIVNLLLRMRVVDLNKRIYLLNGFKADNLYREPAPPKLLIKLSQKKGERNG